MIKVSCEACHTTGGVANDTKGMNPMSLHVMRRTVLLLVVVCGLLGLSVAAPAHAEDTVKPSPNPHNPFVHPAETGGITADRVYGQPNFTSGAPNNGGISAGSLNAPNGIAIDSTGKVYISDAFNNRILVYPADSTTATEVYGQPDFKSSKPNNGGLSASSLSSPNALALDSSDGLYVADFNNNRVLYFPAGQKTASRVYGQSSFTTSTSGTTATTTNQPIGVGVAADGGILVADYGNNRVLYYPAGSPNTDAAASRVYGQTAFTTRASGAGTTGLNSPTGVVADAAGNVYVADYDNNRVVVYPAGSPASGASASRVYGQLDFTTISCVHPGAATLCQPVGLSIGANNLLTVADSGNNRALTYPTTGTTATRVYGQPDFVHNGFGGPTADTFNSPTAALDTGSRLFVADNPNCRVLRFPSQPVASKLAFTTQPGGAAARALLSPQPVVTVQDPTSVTATGYNGTVTLTLSGGTAGALLEGTTTLTFVNGVAAFTDLSVDKVGTGYTLTATTTGLASANSAAFNISAATYSLTFTAQPTNGDAAAPLSPQPVVEVRNADNSLATGYNGSVTVAIKSGTGTATAKLTGTVTRPVVNGVATFTDLAIDLPGANYVLDATAPGVARADSQPFTLFAIGAYVGLQLHADPAASNATAITANLTLVNHSGADIPAGTKITFSFGGVAFTAKDRTANTITGATWLSLGTTKGVATLAAALPNNSVQTLTLHLTLIKPLVAAKLKIKATLPAKIGSKKVTFSSNSISSINTDGGLQTLVAKPTNRGKAGPKTTITYSGAFFANGEPVRIVGTPATSIGKVPAKAGSRGTISIKTTPSPTPGTYTVQVVGLWSGTVGTASVTLT